jgi:D-amino-acid dehydrogenase
MGLNVAVVGAGVVGLCCASYLQRDGHAVTIFDPVPPGGSTSFGNLGSLAPGSCVPLATPGILGKVPRWLLDRDGPLHIAPRRLAAAVPWLMRFVAASAPSRVRSIADALSALHAPVFDCYAPLLKDAGAEDLVRRLGQLYVFETEDSYAHSRFEIELRRARGERQETVGADELRQLEPALAPRFVKGVYLPDAGHCVDPERLVIRLAEGFCRNGGVVAAERVLAIRPDGDGRVEMATERGAQRVDRVVVAGGAWSNALLRPLGASVPIESLRGYHVVLRRIEAMPRMALRFAEAKLMATPMDMGLRIGGMIEIAGLRAPPRAARARALARLGARLFRGADAADYTEWMGHRPGTPDSLPVIGSLPGATMIYCAFGHGSTGLTGAASTGRLVADLIARRRPFIDPAPYRPERF